MAREHAIYTALILLYPHAFWRTFHEELEDDFEEGSVEAREAGPAAVWKFRLRTAGDLAVSLLREWLRTPWIPVLITSASISMGLFAFAAFKVRQWPQYASWPVHREFVGRSDSLRVIVVMTIGVLIPIIGTILASLWMILLQRTTSNRPRRRV